MKNQKPPISSSIPVIDIFAGPGGLGEGFTECHDKQGKACFKIVLSIEKEEYAHKTLKLRAFYRQFERNRVPDLYYRFLRNEITETELYDSFPEQAELASLQAWKAELGVTDMSDVDKRIRQALADSKEWILIGGPPCQAYS
ncbi:DNA cytosine methyltransferase, partial [candidate division KSB1 bacterium]|nr:DNA cytosine methyltransferase [candidate division KSB1 bacterium]